MVRTSGDPVRIAPDITPHFLSGGTRSDKGKDRAQTENEDSRIFHISLSGNKRYPLA
jgi:hypothetical protein